MRRAIGLVGCVLALATAAPVGAEPIETGPQPDCLNAVPTVVAYDFAQPVDLQVLVLLDGVSQGTAENAFALASTPYAPLGIRLHAQFAPAPAVTATDPIELLDATRDALGGRRPDGINLVYVITSKDLVSATTGGSVAGQADCNGGVGFLDRGFAVGEVDDLPPSGLGLFGNITAKIQGHELGHLLGAHHHYANCVEAPPADADHSGCTLLINDVSLAELKFSTLNAAVIRGHAEYWTTHTPGWYGSPPSEPSEPEPDPSSPQDASSGGPQDGGSPPPAATPAAQSPRPSWPCRRAQARHRRALAALRSAQRAHRRAHTRRGRRRTARTVARRRAALRVAARAALKACR